MKAKIAFIALLNLILITSNLFSQSRWVWLNPLPHGYSHYDVEFADQNTGYATTVYGVIMKTTNGGLSWALLLTPAYFQFFNLSVVNANTFYATANASAYLKSTDGGITWIFLETSYDFLYSIDFTDINTGYITAGNVILKTTNGGQNHTTLFPQGTLPNILDIDFLNSQTGYLVNDEGLGAYIIQKTTNGGLNWFYLYNVTAYQENFSGIYFINENTGFAYTLEGFRNVKTTNGGTNWSVVNDLYQSGIYSISFFDSFTGYASGYMKLFKSTDGGNSWKSNQAPYLGKISVLSAGKVVTPIVYTTNSGVNWVNLINSFTKKNLKDLFFINSATGYIIRDGQYNEMAKIYKTTNCGVNWDSNNIDYTNVYKLRFVNESTGFVSTGGTSFFRTTNGGANWIQFNFGANNMVYHFHFINASSGYSVTSARQIYKTTNSGINWFYLSTATGGVGTPQAIYFVNDQTGFLTRLRTVHRTTNSGLNWEIVHSAPASEILKYIYFPEENIGYLPLRNNKVMKTTDYGNTWAVYTVDNLDTNVILEGANIHFININTGYIGRHNNVYKTTNGGLNWVRNFPRTGSLNGLFMTSEDTCYIVGDNGAILRTTANVFGIRQLGNVIPEKYNLYQSYPNPFNPKVTIKFDIAENSDVKLVIYDLLGREITTLVSDKLNSGIYQIEWNASNYTSGIYFYRLKAGDYSSAKKMILVK